jgi:hypothetical protein
MNLSLSIRVKILLLTLVLLCCSNSFLWSQSIYVAPGASGSGSIGNPAGLQMALDAARTNDTSDTLFLQSGIYSAAGGTFTYDTTGNDNQSVVISGGWNTAFTNQSLNFSQTILDGNSANQVMAISANKPGLDFNFTLINLTVQNGYTTDRSGAGISTFIGSLVNNDVGNLNLYINHCQFRNNNAQNNKSGGALNLICYFEISNSSFLSNMAYNGGALSSATKPDLDQSMSPLIDNCYFEDNSNYGNQGSTIWHNVTLRVLNSIIKGKTDGVSSAGNGSAIWGNSGSMTIAHNTVFSKIRIQYWGCSVQAFDGGMELVNCVFEDNKVLLNGYGAVSFFHNNGSVNRKIIITNCTFVGNQSYVDQGGAIHMRLNGSDSCIVTNCIFWNNGSYPLISEFATGQSRVSYTLLPSGYNAQGFVDAGNNLIAVNPLFVGANNYHLQSNSPCINAGKNNAPAILPFDIEGKIRNLGGFVDLGVFEFNRAPEALVLNTLSVDENVPTSTLVSTILGTDPDAGDVLQYELIPGNGTNDADNDKFSITGDELHILELPNFEIQAEYHINMRAVDSGSESFSSEQTIQVNDRNDSPMLNNPIEDLVAEVGIPFTFSLPDNTFIDEDSGDEFIYTATQNGNALPAWLNFNGNTGTFSGIPVIDEILTITLTIKDVSLASASDVFILTVSDPEGIFELDQNDFSVYPNPTSGNTLFFEFQLIHDKTLSAKLLNNEGKLVMKLTSVTSGNLIDISALKDGNYLLILSDEKDSYLARFSVIR